MAEIECPPPAGRESITAYRDRLLEAAVRDEDVQGMERQIAENEAALIELDARARRLKELEGQFAASDGYPQSNRLRKAFVERYNQNLSGLEAELGQDREPIRLDQVTGEEANQSAVKKNLQAITGAIAAEMEALNAEQTERQEGAREMIKRLQNRKGEIKRFVEECVLAEKAKQRGPDKLTPGEANNNRLLIAALPYAALNMVLPPCPELFDDYLAGGRVNPDFNIHSYKTLCGLLMNICLAYVVKYTKKSKQVEQVPGYKELFEPHAATIMKALPVISDVDIEESFSNFNARGQNLGSVLASKTNDVERAILASTIYSLPTMVYTVEPGKEPLPTKNAALQFNNATVKPRFLQQSLRQNEMFVNYCDSAARLLDMGGDGCRTPPSDFPQSYEFAIEGRNMNNRTRLVFSDDGKNYEINMAFGEPIVDLEPGEAYGDFKDYGFNYSINETKSVEQIGNMFSKRGAAQQMAAAFINGLNSIQTKANLNNVTTRYNLFLRNPTWINPLLTGAAHKMFGDLCRDTLELFTKFSIKTDRQTSDAILANNDRPAQAMATFMAAALDDANSSGSCWATDTTGKDPNQVMAVWGVRGKPSWTTKAELDSASIVNGINGIRLVPGQPPANDYKDVVPILMAALDGIHDFVPSSTFMQKLASAFSETRSGGGKVKKQKGGAPDYDPSDPSAFERGRLVDELQEYAEANSIMIAIDQALEVGRGFMELNKIYVSGKETPLFGYHKKDIDTLFIVERASTEYVSPERLFINKFSDIAFRDRIRFSQDKRETLIVPFPDKDDYDTVRFEQDKFSYQLFNQLSDHGVSAQEAETVKRYLDESRLEKLYGMYTETHDRISEALSVTQINAPNLLRLLGLEERAGMGFESKPDSGSDFTNKAAVERLIKEQGDMEWLPETPPNSYDLDEGAAPAEAAPAPDEMKPRYTPQTPPNSYDFDLDELARLGALQAAEYVRAATVSIPPGDPTRKHPRNETVPLTPPLSMIKRVKGSVSGGKRRTMKNKSKSKRNAKNQTHRKRKGKAVGKRTATAHRPKTARNAKKITKKSESNTKTKRSAKPFRKPAQKHAKKQEKKRAINRRARNARKDRK